MQSKLVFMETNLTVRWLRHIEPTKSIMIILLNQESFQIIWIVTLLSSVSDNDKVIPIHPKCFIIPHVTRYANNLNVGKENQ